MVALEFVSWVLDYVAIDYKFALELDAVVVWAEVDLELEPYFEVLVVLEFLSVHVLFVEFEIEERKFEDGVEWAASDVAADVLTVAYCAADPIVDVDAGFEFGAGVVVVVAVSVPTMVPKRLLASIQILAGLVSIRC